MENYMEVVKNLGFFSGFVIVIFLIVFLFLNLYLKKFKFTPRKARVYGILFELDNNLIVSLALSSVNYLFLVWCAMTSASMSTLYMSIIFITSFLSVLISKDYIKLPINLIVCAINCFALYLIDYIHVYLLGETSDILMRICVFFMVAFAFIYFTYNYINDINDIVERNKFLQKKLKRGKK